MRYVTYEHTLPQMYVPFTTVFRVQTFFFQRQFYVYSLFTDSDFYSWPTRVLSRIL